MAISAGPWAIVVPVKRLAEAKTRLLLPPDVRMDLALAMALDTVGAALACESTDVVVAVCDDDRATRALRSAGALVVADEPDAGLNPALLHGATAADLAPGHAVATLAADLPALRTEDLARVLADVSARMDGETATSAVVADMSGTGTTLLAAASAADLRPAFGPQSRSAHVAGGATDLTDVAPMSVRRDVDTLDDLRAAAGLGLGTASARVLERHRELLLGASN